MQVYQAIPCNRKEGHVGIEIECEGDNLPQVSTKYWRTERDSSLKKDNSWEYVLKEPVHIDDVNTVIEELYEIFDANDSVVDESVRAGVHVHINVQDMEMICLFNLITIYLTLEEVIVGYCGENRQGNLFCLRALDARYLIVAIIRAIQGKKLKLLHTDDIRYASINLKALFEYGSLEFRAMRSTPDHHSITTWIKLLYQLKQSASNFSSPEEVMYLVSSMGAVNFAKHILGEHSHLFTWDEVCVAKLRNGINNAQDIAFCTDWSNHFVVNNNPFVSRGFI